MKELLRRVTVLASGISLSIGCAADPAADASVLVDTVGTATRTMSVTPMDSGSWHLVEVGRIDLSAEGPGAIGYVRDLTLFDDGTIAVADLRPAAVHLFSAAGTWQRQVGGMGSGPGEYEDAFLARAGDTLVVQDRRNSRAIWFGRDGAALHHVPTACCMTEGIGIDAAGRVMVPASNGREGTKLWVRVRSDGSAPDSLVVHDSRFVAPPVWSVTGPGGGFGKLVPLVPAVRVAPDAHDGFVIGWSGEYLLRRSATGRDTVALFGRTLSSRERMDDVARQQFAEASAQRDALVEGLPVEQLRAAYDPTLLPEEPELFDALWVDPAGRTWVQRTGGDTTTVQLDLFDAEGRLLDEVRVPAAGWPTMPYQRPVSWTRDGAAVAVQTDSGFTVIRYRIVRD